ncbi:ATP-binding protein [Streptomyces sp. NPDC002640]
MPPSQHPGVHSAWWPCDSSSIPGCRSLAREYAHSLRGTGAELSPEDEEQLLIVVSELVTNAVKYTDSRFQLHIAAGFDPETLEVSVDDTSRRQPVVSAADGTRVGGHGLEIVQHLSVSLTAHTTTDGKRVTAVLHRTPISPPRGGPC